MKLGLRGEHEHEHGWTEILLRNIPARLRSFPGGGKGRGGGGWTIMHCSTCVVLTAPYRNTSILIACENTNIPSQCSGLHTARMRHNGRAGRGRTRVRTSTELGRSRNSNLYSSFLLTNVSSPGFAKTSTRAYKKRVFFMQARAGGAGRAGGRGRGLARSCASVIPQKQ